MTGELSKHLGRGPMKLLLFCHNPACRQKSEPGRRNQKHCDSLCGNRCRLCAQAREQRYKARLRGLRKDTRRGLAPASTEPATPALLVAHRRASEDGTLTSTD